MTTPVLTVHQAASIEVLERRDFFQSRFSVTDIAIKTKDGATAVLLSLFGDYEVDLLVVPNGRVKAIEPATPTATISSFPGVSNVA